MCAAILFVVKMRTPGGEKNPPAHHHRVVYSTRDQRGAFPFFYRYVTCLNPILQTVRPFISHAHDLQTDTNLLTTSSSHLNELQIGCQRTRARHQHHISHPPESFTQLL